MSGLMSAGAVARRVFVAVCCVLGLAACGTSGRGFQSSALWQVVPGQTTVRQASDILGGEPVNIYRRLDGSLVARWAHSASLVTDAVYFRQDRKSTRLNSSH